MKYIIILFICIIYLQQYVIPIPINNAKLLHNRNVNQNNNNNNLDVNQNNNNLDVNQNNNNLNVNKNKNNNGNGKDELVEIDNKCSCPVPTETCRCENDDNSYEKVATTVLHSDQPNENKEVINVPINLQSITNIKKGKTDDKDYKFITLKNGLNVMLISDKNTILSAASMQANTGSLNDPEEIPGLSHFLEHMLFLGTKKYPKAGSFDDFIGDNGGYGNAFTAEDKTNFHFNVDPSVFKQALDQFSQFFIDPLFSVESTSSEMNAVDSEYQKNLNSDDWKLTQISRHLTKVEHPYHKFGTGNIDTLSKYPAKTIREYLVNYWREHYYASNMILTLLGKESIEELEKYANLFEGVEEQSSPENKIPLGVEPQDKMKVPVGLYDEKTLGSFVLWASESGDNAIKVQFQLPPQELLYKKKSINYIASLISLETTGTAMDILKKKKGWVNNIEAGIELSTMDFTIFSIDVPLTVAGVDHIPTILKILFNYINFIGKEGIQEWKYNEYGKLSELDFEFESKGDPIEVAKGTSESIGKYIKAHDIENCIYGGYEYSDFDEKHINSLLNFISLDNALVFISGSDDVLEKYFNTKLDVFEPWYKTKYHVSKMSQKFILENSVEAYKPLYKFILPKKNEFIPQGELQLIPATTKYIKDKKPVNIIKGNNKLWLNPDITYKKPTVEVRAVFWNGDISSSAKNIVYTRLFLRLLDDVLESSPVLSRTSFANYFYGFEMSTDGIEFSSNGYTAGFAKYLTALKGELGKVKLIPARFKSILEEYKVELSDFTVKAPHEIAAYSLELLLESSAYRVEDEIEILGKVTIEELNEFYVNNLKSLGSDIFISGNVDEKSGREIYNGLVGLLDTFDVQSKTGKPKFRFPNHCTTKINQLDQDYRVELLPFNEDEENSCSYHYYQVAQEGLNDPKPLLLAQILANILEQPIYDELRTKQQLGYIVWSGVDQREDILGFRIIVQSSPKYDAAYLSDRIDNFTRTYNVNSKEFAKSYESTVNSIRERLQKPEPTIEDQTDAMWFHITNGKLDFDAKKMELDALKTIKIEEVKAFYNIVFKKSHKIIDHVSKGVPEKLPIKTLTYEDLTKQQFTQYKCSVL